MALNISEKIMRNSSTKNSAIDNFIPNFPLYTVALLLLIILIGIIGNILLVVSHVKDPFKLMKSLSSYFIFNISLVDLLLPCTLILATLSLTKPSFYDVASSLIAWLYTVSFTLYLNLAIQWFYSAVLFSGISIVVYDWNMASKRCLGWWESYNVKDGNQGTDIFSHNSPEVVDVFYYTISVHCFLPINTKTKQ